MTLPGSISERKTDKDKNLLGADAALSPLWFWGRTYE